MIVVIFDSVLQGIYDSDHERDAFELIKDIASQQDIYNEDYQDALDSSEDIDDLCDAIYENDVPLTVYRAGVNETMEVYPIGW